MSKDERQLYVDCIGKQLEEIELLNSIYCGPGELQILDPACVCDFEQFLKDSNSYPVDVLRTNLEFIVKLEVLYKNSKEKFDVRIELPHLYPTLEHPILTIQNALLTKEKIQYFKMEIEKYIDTLDKQSSYVFQLLTWIQEQIENILDTELNNVEATSNVTDNVQDEIIEFERLWIYSHHIKSKTKRQLIVKQSRDLQLTGFCRPGKPGIICVEGVRRHTQEFWSIIKALHWQKISVCKNEIKKVTRNKLEKLRRFEGFKEQIFCNDDHDEDVVMDMALFIKFLETHNSGYMKKELFGIE